MAFAHCTSVGGQNDVIPDDPTGALTKIIIPETITKIGHGAFTQSWYLVAVEGMESVEELVEYAFDKTNIKSVYLGDKVTKIGKNAFGHCPSLERAVVHADLTTEGDSIFVGCEKLRYIYFNAHEVKPNVIYGCKALDTLEFGPNVKEIDHDLCKDESNLHTIIFDAATEKHVKIGNNAFLNCVALKEVKNPNVIEEIGNNCFRNCPNLPESLELTNLKTIGNYEFYGCPQVKEIKYTDKIVSIGDCAFKDLTNLQCAIDLTSVETIGNSAFENTVITSLNLGTSCKSIGNYAFKKCSSVTGDVSLDNVQTIGEEAFMECTGLNVKNLNSVVTIGNKSFRGTAITSLTLPTTCTSVGNYAFYGCKELTTADLSNSSITMIDRSTFEECTKLDEVTLPNTLERICQDAFKRVVVKELLIPNSVSTLEAWSLSHMPKLTNVTISSKVTTIPTGLFIMDDKDANPALEEITLPESVTSIEE